MFKRTYSLKKSRALFHWANTWYQKNWKQMTVHELQFFEEKLEALDQALVKRDRATADSLAREIEIFGRPRVKKSAFLGLLELIGAIAFALVVATIIRQTWFELYQIPTGSMRPTYREMDHLIVSKTSFGLNRPFLGGQFFFDPQAVQRGGVVIWSGVNIDLPDTDTKYFWFFPVKKRYIKRLIGKPGDTLYFYGGKVWGIDAEGNDLPELRKLTDSEHLEYLPFSQFEGRPMLRHFNEEFGRIILSPPKQFRGEIYNGKEWIADDPFKAISDTNHVHTYTDSLGMGNFGMARILTREEVENIDNIKPEEKAPLYLEIRHHPNLSNPKPYLFDDMRGTTHALLRPQISLLPLSTEKMKSLMDGLYTARFVVKQGFAHRYTASSDYFSDDAPSFPGIPDGTYEFYHGKAYQVKWVGYLEELPATHPLYHLSPMHLQKLFNLGIEFSMHYAPSNPRQFAYPSRYAYFRDGDLYVMGAPLFTKDDPVLQKFVEKEKEKQEKSTASSPYQGFLDAGAPDKQKIETFGLKVPEKSYVVLGDNHAMSGDSRYFGFVPESNLEGTPTFILWPAGPRWGWAAHKNYPWLTLPNLCVGGVVILISGVGTLYHRRKERKNHFIKQPRS